MPIPKMIAVDFDGTCCDFAYPGVGAPKAGVREVLTRLRELGFYILIYSCRSSFWFPESFPRELRQRTIDEMTAWLKLHAIPYDEIDDGTRGKPFCDLYIDDKAIRFENNWTDIMGRIAKGELI